MMLVLMLSFSCQKAPEVPPSPELLKKIKTCIRSSDVKIYRNIEKIPLNWLTNGAKVTVKMEDPMFINPTATCVSDLTSPIQFQGGKNCTIYKGGRGAVILEGKNVYIYNLTVTENELKKE